MKARTALIVLIAAPLMGVAQTDTTSVKEPGMQALEVGITPKDGFDVRMIDGDTVTKSGSWTIDTKYKRITITTEPKPWASTSDSIAEVIHDRKVERRNQFTYWSGVDVGVNTLLAADGSTDLPKEAEFMEIDNAKSRFVSINFMEQKIEFGSHHAGLLTGLGWEFVNYRLKNNSLLAYNADSIYGVPVDEPDFRKNKLRQMGLRMPLMLEFNTQRSPLPTEADVMAMRADTTGALRRSFKPRHDRNFHIALGVVGSWYFDTMYKQKYTEEGNDRKDRDKGDYLLLPYRAAAAVRVGYGGLNLFAEYALTPLFKEGKGPELTPLTIGFTIIGFN